MAWEREANKLPVYRVYFATRRIGRRVIITIKEPDALDQLVPQRVR